MLFLEIHHAKITSKFRLRFHHEQSFSHDVDTRSKWVAFDLKREKSKAPPISISTCFYFYLHFFLKHAQNSRTKEISNDVDGESENEIRTFQSRKRSSDQISSSVKPANKCNSPIHPHQDLVKCIEKLQNGDADDAITKNAHYELINVPSESSLKLNSTATPKFTVKHSAQWHPSCEKINDLKQSAQTTSMTHLNINNNIDNGNQQLGSGNLGLLRSRTHGKSLSTRISSLKRESKTTRTLSIVMFR